MGKDTHIQVKEAHRVPNKMNPKKSTRRLIAVNVEEKILKTAKVKQPFTYKRSHISRFFSRNFTSQKRGAQHIQSIERKSSIQEFATQAKLLFRIEGKIEFSI